MITEQHFPFVVVIVVFSDVTVVNRLRLVNNHRRGVTPRLRHRRRRRRSGGRLRRDDVIMDAAHACRPEAEADADQLPAARRRSGKFLCTTMIPQVELYF